MKFDISDEQMKGLFTEAILAAIDDKARENLIREAIVHLTAEQERSVGSYRTEKFVPLQEAFNQCAVNVAREKCLELLRTDEKLNATLEAVVREGIDKAITEKRADMVNRVALGVASALMSD